jgi:hypothetical protein
MDNFIFFTDFSYSDKNFLKKEMKEFIIRKINLNKYNTSEKIADELILKFNLTQDDSDLINEVLDELRIY